MITHFTKHADEATAKAALPSYWTGDVRGWDWNRSIVDGPIPVRDNDGTGPLSAGYFLNIALPALNTSLPGLTGAGHTDPITKAWITDWGNAPITPQRVFAWHCYSLNFLLRMACKRHPHGRHDTGRNVISTRMGLVCKSII